MSFLDILNNMPPESLKELNDLQDVPQDAVHHPEGDAYIHSVYVFDAAVYIAAREGLPLNKGRVLLNAAITHDLGKAATTVVHADGRITAYGHPDAGVPLAETMLRRLEVDEYTITQVLPLVREHMAWTGFYMSQITKRAVRRLARRLHPATVEMWALLVEADMDGRPPRPGGLPERALEILTIARELGISEGITDDM